MARTIQIMRIYKILPNGQSKRPIRQVHTSVFRILHRNSTTDNDFVHVQAFQVIESSTRMQNVRTTDYFIHVEIKEPRVVEKNVKWTQDAVFAFMCGRNRVEIR